jgi:hypothetical protein
MRIEPGRLCDDVMGWVGVCRGWCGEWRIHDVNGYVGMVSKPANILMC